MANPRKASRKSKTLLEKQKYTAEITSRQLVIGVCILIAFGLACFMLGVIVGRFDPVHSELTASDDPSETFRVSGTDSSPDPETTKAASPPAKTTKPTPTAPKASTQTKKPPAPPSKQDENPDKIKPTATATAAAKRTQQAANPPKPPPTPPKTDTPTEKQPTPTTPSTSEAAKDTWTVQVGVFRTRANAAKRKAQIEEKSSLKAELLDSADGKQITVIVGKYASLDAAAKVRDRLRKEFGYKDSWARKRKT